MSLYYLPRDVVVILSQGLVISTVAGRSLAQDYCYPKLENKKYEIEEKAICMPLVHTKNSVLLIPTGLTVTCVMRLILLSWQHECHKNPSNKPPPCACLRW